MDRHLDRAAVILRGHCTRRVTVSAGVTALALGLMRPALADDATPTSAREPNWLFVQRFSSATLDPDPATAGEYVLIIAGLEGPALAFTDHPDRMVATLTNAALAELVDAAGDPLNATLIARLSGSEEEAIAVVTLLNAHHDEDAGSITYRVTVLAEAEEQLLEPMAPPTGTETFAVGHLFIDGAPYEPGISFETGATFKFHQKD